jgi:hypothetical protein
MDRVFESCRGIDVSKRWLDIAIEDQVFDVLQTEHGMRNLK